MDRRAKQKSYMRKQRSSNSQPNVVNTGNVLFDQSVMTAEKLWNDIKQRVKDNPEFATMEDRKKLELYQTGDFKLFYNTYPIVSRYMICMGQYSTRAFKRFLKKFEMTQKKARSANNEEKMDQWMRCQASYIRFLWESYQKQHFSAQSAQMVWQQSYQTLKQEYADFEQMQKDVELQLKKNKKLNKAELIKEMANRIANEQQQLSSSSASSLIKKLEVRLIQQRWEKMQEQIKTDVATIPPSRTGRGKVKV